MSNNNSTLKTVGKVLIFIFAILLIAGIVSSIIPEKKPQKSETDLLTEEREEFPLSICERWKSRYPIIPANLSNNYKIGEDKNLVMEVGMDDWSREVVFLKKVSFFVSSPLEFELQSGDVLTIEPEKGLIDLSGEKIFKIRGKEKKGCILFY